MTLLANLIVTSIMTGIIWLVQLVVYPAFREVSQESHSSYHQRHVAHIGPLVAPLMVIEFILAALWTWESPEKLQIIHLCCAIFLWLSTFLIQVPLHQKLSLRFDLSEIDALVRTNWIRTILWTIKLIIISYATFQTHQ